VPRLRHHVVAAVAACLLGMIAPIPAARASGFPAPVLISPVGGVQSGVSVTFAWDRVSGASAYRLRVHHATPGGPIHIDVETVNDTYVGLVNFAGDTAWWEVAALNATGDAGAWAQASFTTAAIAPTLVWPPDGATINHPDEWPALEFDHVPGQTEGIFAELGDTADPGDPPSRFGPGTWSWQVRSSKGPGDPISHSPSSEVRSFTYAWPQGTPTLLSPANGHILGTTEALRLRWAPVPGASMYQWELTLGGQTYKGSTETHATWADILGDGSPDDIPPGTYQWRVRAVLSGTSLFPIINSPQFGPWSPARSVTIPGSPSGTPTQTSPANAAALTAWPVLRWDPVPGASAYGVQVSDSEDLDAHEVNTPVNAFSFHPSDDEANPDPMFQVTEGSATRHWRVRGYGAQYGTDPGAWSSWRSFTVTTSNTLLAETTATRIGPVDCPDDTCPDLDGLPLLRWDAVAGAASYRVFIRWDGGLGASNTWSDVGSVGFPLQSYQPTTPTSHVAWSVRACPATGCSTSMPAGRSYFRVAFPAPVQTGPADGTEQGASAVEMSWVESAPPAGPDNLQRALSTEIEMLVTPGEFGPTDLHRNFVDQPIYTIDGLRDAQSVAWRVRGSLRTGVLETVGGAWSPWRTITRAEPAITLTSPADGAHLVSAPVLDWAGLPYEVDGYEWELAKTSTLAEMIAQHPENEELYADRREITGATSARLAALAPGEYRWRVRRVGSGLPNREHDGAWTTRTFTISGPDTPAELQPAAGATVPANDGVLTWGAFAITPNGASSCSAAAPNAVDQVVEVATSPTFSDGSIVYRKCAERWVTTQPIQDLLPTGSVYWRVCAAFDCSSGRLLNITAAPGPDTTSPSTAGLKIQPALNGALTATDSIPATVSWAASDVGTGIASQELQVRRGAGAWTAFAQSASARSATVNLRPGSNYSVRIRATDVAGNVGPWTTRSLETVLRQNTSSHWTWTGPWTTAHKASASGDSTRWSTTGGATATMRTSASAFAVVAPRSVTRGNVSIYVDGLHVATVKLDAAPTGPRRIVWTKSWTSAGTHRITLRVRATAGHPRVDLDALVIFRSP
jgi:hypothetical protein